MKKRIFIAVVISKGLQNKVLMWAKKYKELSVRWLAGKNLHITLVPPWYESNIKNQISKIKKIKAEPFEIEFNRVAYGPDPKRPRLIWAEGKASEGAVDLKNKLEKNFPEHKSTYKEWLMHPERGRKGSQRASASYGMHMTIARFDPKEFSSFPIKTIDEEVIWRDKIGSFVLMESHLSREGSDYEILKTFKLK